MAPKEELQAAMWDMMQRSGYFRFHPIYKGWNCNSEVPPPVLREHCGARKEIPDFLKNIDFKADEIVFHAAGNAFETCNQEIDPALKEIEEIWLRELVSLKADMIVLDIGCGYGRTEEWMWRYVREIHGVDISEYIIEVCQKRFSEISNVYFYRNNGKDLFHFCSEMFDFIYAFNVFQHIPREFTESYLESIKRVLRRGGMSLFNILSGINYATESGPFAAEWAIGYSRDMMKGIVEKKGLCVHRVLTWRVEGVEPYWLWFLVGH